MYIGETVVTGVQELQENIFLLSFNNPQIDINIKPGQFFNIKVCDSYYPLLRRPFSICDVENDNLSILFSVFGEGTKILANKKKGETINLLGPLGNGFSSDGNYDTAVIIAGGLGIAPFPYLTKIIGNSKEIISFAGGRNANAIIKYGMKNLHVATDDGSLGFHGNVVQLFSNQLKKISSKKIKVYSCGPNVMLKAVKEICTLNNIPCELSTECAMACGIGICQGCPIESSEKDKYYLVCKDGPVFNAKDIHL